MSQSPFTRGELEQVASRYAPYIKLHPDERFPLANVDWYIHNSTLHGPNVTIPHPTVADLPIGGDDDDSWWLDMDDVVKGGHMAEAKLYVHALWNQELAYTDIQYWIFYGYNGPGRLKLSNIVETSVIDLKPLGEHWADWEMVMVRVDNASRSPLGVYLSQHGSGEWITDLSRFQRHGDQFIIYPSLNGHANYADTGEHPTESGNYLLIQYSLMNYAADGGAEFDGSSKIEIVAADFIPNFQEARWLGYVHRWGKGTKSYLSNEAIEQILLVALAPYAWLSPFLSALAAILAPIIFANKSLDDTNGIHGPETQRDYWNDSNVPQMQFEHRYTGVNTNRGNPPAIVYFNDVYHLYYQDGDGNNGIMHQSSQDGWSWSDRSYIGKNTSSGLGAVVFRGKVHLFYRDGNGNGVLHVTSDDGRNFGSHEYIGINIDGAPSAAAIGDDRMCAVGRDHGGYGVMYASKWRDGGWDKGYTGQTTNRGVAPDVIGFNDLFQCYYQDGNGNNGVMLITSDDGKRWSDHTYTRVTTSAGPCAIAFKGKVRLFFRDGNGNGIMYGSSDDGRSFSHVMYTGLNCDDQPHACCKDSMILIPAIDHDGNGIMMLKAY